MKKWIVIMTGIFVFAAGICARNIHANNAEMSISKEQAIQETAVTDEEKAKLAELGYSFEEIEKKCLDQVEFEFDIQSEHGKTDYSNYRWIVFSGGAMTASPLGSEGGYTVDSRTGITLAVYNPSTDPNGVDTETAKDLQVRYMIRENVNQILKESEQK